MALVRESSAPTSLQHHFCSVRQQTESLCQPLTPEDMMVQSCDDASPVKWHLAHTTWFFETFILREFSAGYREFHPDFIWLFNSYYNAVGEQPEKKLRASFSRPSLTDVLEYRRHVEIAIEKLFEQGMPEEAQQRLILGLHHEQQHQELIATDIKHALWTNPLHPAYLEGELPSAADKPTALSWASRKGGLIETGFAGEGFCFDNETPRHRAFLEPFQIATRVVTCSEYLAFMEDGGYERPEFWLSEGWDAVSREGWKAPLYWRKSCDSDEWLVYTMRGVRPFVQLSTTPVCHVSFFEADAYARWTGKRLPTEVEWEEIASAAPVTGNLLEGSRFHPAPASAHEGVQQLFGDVWEWTASAYTGYPGYSTLPGALGEYNGKFMSSKMVLRGGSVVTPASHIRATYRNYFTPSTRWQFSGIRLAQS